MQEKERTYMITGRLIDIGYSKTRERDYISIKTEAGFESGGVLDLTPDSVLQARDIIDNRAKYLDTMVTAVIYERGYSRTVLKIRPAES